MDMIVFSKRCQSEAARRTKLAKRIKKAAVSPEISRQWLRRFEEYGESPPQIARADHYDVRTVRKQIESARQEREAREARSLVLRQALEHHYADLVVFAQKVDHALSDPVRIPLAEKNDRIWLALRAHLPRSPMWKGVGKWEHLHQELSRLEEAAVMRLHDEVKTYGSLAFAQEGENLGLNARGLSTAIIERLRLVARVPDKSPAVEEPRCEPAEQGLVRIVYGGLTCATVSAEQGNKARELVRSLIARANEWPESLSMQEALSELTSVSDTVREELATITLRRIVPGRCKYCPV